MEGMSPAPAVIEWRGRGCGCLLLSVGLSAAGWRIEFQQPSGSVPNRGSALGEGGSWDDRPEHGHLRFGAAAPRVWLLPLDLADWPTFGQPPEYRTSGTPAVMQVNVRCTHGPANYLHVELLADVDRCRATRRRVLRVVTMR